MEIARGILVDAKGNFLGAFQWDASKPRPQFNLPRSGYNSVQAADLKTLLAETVAEPGMEFKRWNFKKEIWIEPDQTSWFVDEKGALRGSRRHFADQLPNIPIGWILTNVVPPKSRSQRPYFDHIAERWKFPLRLARVENNVLMNFECVRDDYVSPPGVEYIERPRLVNGEHAPLGTVRTEGIWTISVVES